MIAWAVTVELLSHPGKLALGQLDSLSKVQNYTCIVMQPLYESGPEYFYQPGFFIRFKQY
jgi:hypothetical protein